MDIKNIMQSLEATNEEQILADAEGKVDDIFSYERPMVVSNINEA